MFIYAKLNGDICTVNIITSIKYKIVVTTKKKIIKHKKRNKALVLVHKFKECLKNYHEI